MKANTIKGLLQSAEAFGPDFNESPCLCLPRKPDKLGYVKVSIGGRRWLAHRAAYEELVGPIPAGLTIDHLCRNRACVNPLHLEAVSNEANILRGIGQPAQNARKTHCSNGHALSGDNVRITKRGWRACKECGRANYRRWARENPETVSTRMRAWHRENVERTKVYWAKNKHRWAKKAQPS